MHAIEFIATLHNGVVSLPSQYREQWDGKTIRVLLLEETAPATVTRLEVESSLELAEPAHADAPVMASSSQLESGPERVGPAPADAPLDRPPAVRPPTLLTQLQQIKITAPVDFSENLDQYLNGEKHV
ncbi:MAG: hypothetical protein ACO331_08515 [Prochlorothrix sp.]